MNKYLACISLVAFCFCLTGAVTRQELSKAMHEANSATRAQGNNAIQIASRDAMLKATSPLQKICIATKLGPAYRDLNLALNQQLVADQTKYQSLTEEEVDQIDATALWQELCEGNLAASTAQKSIDEINQCTEQSIH